jgi:ketosteroid isomerase-like protein
MELWELAAREEIRELVARYATNCDSGRFDEVAALFAPDAILEPDGVVYQGHEAIRGMFTRAFNSIAVWPEPVKLRHMTTSLTIDVADQGGATSRCYYAVLMSHGLDHWGHYDDEYAVVDERWLFSHRREFIDGMTPGGWAETVTSGRRSS